MKINFEAEKLNGNNNFAKGSISLKIDKIYYFEVQAQCHETITWFF